MIVNSCPWDIVVCYICYVIVPENLVVSCNGDMEHLGLLLVFVYLICFLILNRGSTPYMQVKKMSFSLSLQLTFHVSSYSLIVCCSYGKATGLS